MSLAVPEYKCDVAMPKRRSIAFRTQPMISRQQKEASKEYALHQSYTGEHDCGQADTALLVNCATQVTKFEALLEAWSDYG